MVQKVHLGLYFIWLYYK